MMGLTSELALLLLMAALYLWEGTHAMPAGRVLVERRGLAGRGVWRARFGAAQWQWRGRELVWPSLLMPWRPVMVLPLALSRIGQEARPADAEWPELPVGTGLPFGLVMVLLFVGVPLGLWLHWPARLWGLLMAEVYLCMVLGYLGLWMSRDRLGLSGQQLLKLAAEGLLCPPMAVHGLRKACLLSPLSMPAAQVWLELEGLEVSQMDTGQLALWQDLRDRVAVALDWAPEHDAQRPGLLEARRWLDAKEGA